MHINCSCKYFDIKDDTCIISLFFLMRDQIDIKMSYHVQTERTLSDYVLKYFREQTPLFLRENSVLINDPNNPLASVIQQ